MALARPCVSQQLRTVRARTPKQGRVADGADAEARRRLFDLGAERGAFATILPARETQFHELPRVELTDEFRQRRRGDAVVADPRGVRQRLAETAQLGFLRSAQIRKRHRAQLRRITRRRKARSAAISRDGRGLDGFPTRGTTMSRAHTESGSSRKAWSVANRLFRGSCRCGGGWHERCKECGRAVPRRSFPEKFLLQLSPVPRCEKHRPLQSTLHFLP